MKHKIFKVLTVTCVDVLVQIEQSIKNGPYVLHILAPRYKLTRQNKAQ